MVLSGSQCEFVVPGLTVCQIGLNYLFDVQMPLLNYRPKISQRRPYWHFLWYIFKPLHTACYRVAVDSSQIQIFLSIAEFIVNTKYIINTGGLSWQQCIV